MMSILFGFLGLSLDVGYLYYVRRTMQTAADAGAAAGAFELKRENYTLVTPAALEEAEANGFGSGNGSVTVNRPPAQGEFAGDNDFVEVVIDQNQRSMFMAVLGINSTDIGVRSVAGLVPDNFGCVYALDGGQDRSFKISTGSTFTTSDCSVIVDSDSSVALSVTNGSSLSAKSILVTGEYEDSGGSVSPDPETGVLREDDPLAGLGAPVSGGPCDYTDFALDNETQTLSPGIYCGGITLEDNSEATMQSGTYILRGGGLQVLSGSSIEGSGVSFYNTSGAGFDYEPILIDSGTEARLSAPQSGLLAGIVFFQDRSAPAGLENKIGSGSDKWFEGTLYFSTQHLQFDTATEGDDDDDDDDSGDDDDDSGDDDDDEEEEEEQQGASWTLIIADTIGASNGAQVNISYDFSSSSMVPPVKRVSLVE